MVTLDTIDLQILSLLSQNCRLPVSILAKKAHTSRDIVSYRILKLKESGVIADFITEIDETKLGYQRYLIYLAFQKVDAEQEQKIIRFIVTNPFVSWTTTSTGKWSIIFDYLAKNMSDISSFLDQFQSQYAQFIHDVFVSPQLSFRHFYSKYYHADFSFSSLSFHKKSTFLTSYIPDQIDLHLLSLLSGNARLDYVSLSQKISLTPNAIKKRLQNLVLHNIITGFTIHPNKALLGYEQYYLQISLVQQSSKQQQQLLSYLSAHSSVNAYYIPLSGFSLEVAVFVKNPGELRLFVLELRRFFGSFLRIQDTMLFYEEPKSNYLPAGVFNSYSVGTNNTNPKKNKKRKPSTNKKIPQSSATLNKIKL